jgi:tRNA G10  N-methylase Trm11
MTTTKTEVPRHPAKYSASILDALFDIADAEADRKGEGLLILDPFAGVGLIHKLVEHGHQTYGVELEHEWAAAHERTEVGNALALEYKTGAFDAVITSPTYGNRLADHHEAKDACKQCAGTGLQTGSEVPCKNCRGSGLSKRNTYRHALGRPLSDGSSAVMQWGTEYREFHYEAWVESIRVIKPAGLLVVNTSNHIRKRAEVPVAEWHLHTIINLGCRIEEVRRVVTPRNREGANGDNRVEGELVIVARTPSPRTPGHPVLFA